MSICGKIRQQLRVLSIVFVGVALVRVAPANGDVGEPAYLKERQSESRYQNLIRQEKIGREPLWRPAFAYGPDL